MSDLTLIERLEKLDGPCRECDAEIAELLGIQAWEYVKSGFGSKEIIAPSFTDSIDAALTLVPDGWELWTAFYLNCQYEVCFHIPDETSASTTSHGEHKYFAIAICIAALRAKDKADAPE